MGSSLTQTFATGSVVLPLTAVKKVDLSLYAGTWYQIAAVPSWFQPPGMHDATATYTYDATDAGAFLHVRNEAVTASGQKTYVTGRIEADNSFPSTEHDTVPGYLLVQFTSNETTPIVSPSPQPYWIVMLDENYTYSVVSEPRRQLLWILSRTPTMSEEQLRMIVYRLVHEHGFDYSFMQTAVKVDSRTRIVASATKAPSYTL